MKYYSEFDLLNPENFRFVTEYDETGTGIDYQAIPTENIRNIPTVDAIEVVRCANCEYYRSSPFGHVAIGWCSIFGHHFKPEFYCAHGDKKHVQKV